MAVKREIVGFDKDEDLVFAAEFPEEKISELRPLFDYGDDEGLHAGSYVISNANRGHVAAILGIELKLDIYYFIETSRVARPGCKQRGRNDMPAGRGGLAGPQPTP